MSAVRRRGRETHNRIKIFRAGVDATDASMALQQLKLRRSYLLDALQRLAIGH